MRERNNNILLERIIEAIDRAEDHLTGFDFNAFSKDRKTYDAVLMQIINIGELVNSLSPEFREEHDNLSWHKAILV
jgi:uncharacterized protein with HEPN domain